MRAAIYNPYLDTLGGGERYTMTVAQILKKRGWDVDVEWKDKGIAQKIKERLGIDLTGVNIIGNINKGKGYDLAFWLSDGSIPLLLAKKNILHFQTPFHDVGGKSLSNRIKLARINKVVVNSRFTKEWIDGEYGVDSLVIYPPVDVESFKPVRRLAEKENIIISVARFSSLQQSKGQDILVKVFRIMVDKGLVGWKLVLAGGSDIGAKGYVDKLKKEAKGYPIEIFENPSFDELRKLYGKSKVFWSASGFGIDEQKEPEKAEHFGIVVVEAMSAGALPIVFSAGGHKEIIADGENGFLWTTEDELLKKTQKVITSKEERIKMAQQARQLIKKYSLERFDDEFGKLI